jgi:hypothetical protein
MTELPWYETIFNSATEKLGQFLDFKIDDELGLNQPVSGLGGNPYPETTAPVNAQPTEAGFVIGNNVTTYGLGFGALLLGFLVYKAVK